MEMHAQRNLSKWAHGPFCLAASMAAAAIPNTAELSVFTRRPKMDLSALVKKLYSRHFLINCQCHCGLVRDSPRCAVRRPGDGQNGRSGRHGGLA